MQVFLQCSRLVLVLTLILVLDSAVQGLPLRRARYQRVRCNPNSNSANCIDEKGPVFDPFLEQSNRILPPRIDPFMRPQNLNDVFPVSEDYSGSGSGSGSGIDFPTAIEQEYQPVDRDEGFYYSFRPLHSDNQDLDQDGPEENFIK
ncbi:serglycin [Hipposideros larvatus]